MKKIIASALLLTAISTLAATTSVPVTYEVTEGNAQCRAKCFDDEATGEQKCKFKIHFDDATWSQIIELKKANGYKKTYFEKSPKEICESGELPMEGEGFKSIKVMLYKTDFSGLVNLF